MADDFVSSLGPAFVAHRLRRLSEQLLEATGPFIRARGFVAPSRSGSMLLLLDSQGEMSITEIAHRLRLSHPFIVKLATTLSELGLVEELPDPQDQRRRMIILSRTGEQQVVLLRRLLMTVGSAYGELFDDAGVDLNAALERIEDALAERPLSNRLDFQLSKRGQD